MIYCCRFKREEEKEKGRERKIRGIKTRIIKNRKRTNYPR
jgi:hypothetical protein